ncbi:MAG: hypothetical protein KKC46_05530 [Proteobacteria bacterium]|nr:hypothetical protein [Pseudomonadota bacterium]
MSKAIKIQKDINANELSAFLRELADTIDGRKEAFDVGVGEHIKDFSKFEIKIKKDMLLASIKLKMEQGEPIKATQKEIMDAQESMLNQNFGG